jgi:cell division protein ZapA (FtsZ GTPase activity inhibitor)
VESFKAKIFGDEYAMMVDNPVLTSEAARKVNGLMTAFKQKAQTASAMQIAVLTAVSLCEELLTAEATLRKERAVANKSLAELQNLAEQIFTEKTA